MRGFFSVPFVWNMILEVNETGTKNLHLSLHVKHSLFLSDFNDTWILYDRFSKNTWT